MKKLLLVGMLAFGMASAQQIGSWYFKQKTDAITDERVSYLSTSTDGADLYIRCTGTILEVFLAVDDYIDNDDITGVYRLDSQKPVSLSFISGTDGDTAFFRANQIVKFITGLKAAKKVVFRIEDYRGSDHTYTFALSGTLTAMKKVSCLKKYI